MRESIANLVLIFAIVRAGGIFVGIHCGYNVKELRGCLRECDGSFLVFDDYCLGVVEEGVCGRRGEFEGLGLVHVTGDRGGVSCVKGAVSYFGIGDDYEGVEVGVEMGEEDVCGMFYTSGTTGIGKAVMLSHRALVMQAMTKVDVVGYSKDTVYLHLAPLYHVGGISSMLAVMFVGGVHVIPEGGFEVGRILKLVRECKVNTLVVVPMMLREIVDFCEGMEGGGAVVEGVEVILCGGGVMGSTLRKDVGRVFGKVRIVETYGMTEAGSSIGFREEGRGGWRWWGGGGGSAGYRCPRHMHVAIKLVDDGKNEIFKDANVVGEILNAGPHTMTGYWKNLEATRNAFVDDNSGTKWLRTGDLGYIGNDGLLHVKGRIKDMIKSGGENVFAAEVESALLVHPRVKEAAVFGVEHRYLGEAVVGAIRPILGSRNDSEIGNGEDVRRWCRVRMTGFKVPKRLWTLTQMPRNSMGKVSKATLRDMLQKEIDEFMADEQERYQKRRIAYRWKARL